MSDYRVTTILRGLCCCPLFLPCLPLLLSGLDWTYSNGDRLTCTKQGMIDGGSRQYALSCLTSLHKNKERQGRGSNYIIGYYSTSKTDRHSDLCDTKSDDSRIKHEERDSRLGQVRKWRQYIPHLVYVFFCFHCASACSPLCFFLPQALFHPLLPLQIWCQRGSSWSGTIWQWRAVE